jgi:uncharacterized protein
VTLTAAPTPASGWRSSRWLILVELAIVALIFVADAHHLIRFSKTPYLVAFAWLSLRVRGLTWRSIGLRLYRDWPTTIALGIAAGIFLEAIELYISQPFLVRVLHKPPDLDAFNALHGNLKLTLLFILLAWVFAAFGEEMIYRGYLMNRVADFFHRTRWAWIFSLLAVHVAFGLAHAYQGKTGIIDEAFMGLLLGALYLATRRNLAVPIVAHGVSDSIDFILIYLGRYPMPHA